jgi:glucosamine-6-phosphate deaminase
VKTPLRTFPSPDALGDHLAERLLQRVERSRLTGNQFLFGCPTGRTPRPILGAMARQLVETGQDLSHVVLVMLDEYLTTTDGTLEYVTPERPWSCHYFARVEILELLNAGLPVGRRIRTDSVWFPDPSDPAGYDARIADAGGVDFFLLASGATDGHVAFNQPGSARETRTRIVTLSDETRRDNLTTFPAFGELSAVPRHGITVGIDTIASAMEAVMVVWGASKRVTLAQMLRAQRYESDWPATVIHECAVREILSDADAATAR